MKQIILGTAGHVDHGKTSLVKALTGVETDRLKEEKERGITIELGFASLSLGKDINIGIVDMPGHEKFVKNMVAGSSGIDLVVMTIAADEGVMPQTREHMEICSLLGIQHGLIALTKTDLVDDDLMELALEDISDYMQGTFLEEAPVVPVSSVTGEGLDDFLKTLNEVCIQVPERSFSSIFRLPVDRVFSMKGFGTVITGTLISGKVNVPLMIHPHDQALMDVIEKEFWERQERDALAYAKAYAAHDGVIWETAIATILRLQRAAGCHLHILHTTFSKYPQLPGHKVSA